MIKSSSFSRTLAAIFFGTVVCIGAFHEYLSCFVSVVLSILLIVFCIFNKKMLVQFDLTSVFLYITVSLYGLSSLWAIDSGMALVGFFKFLPLVLFAMALMQLSCREYILKLLPYFASLLTIVTAICSFIAPISEHFLVAGRFSGSFQYPNTFALFLLISELLLISKCALNKWDVASILVLLSGIVYTGSRTVFVLTVVANVAIVYFTKSGKTKLIFSGVIILTLALASAYGFIFGGVFNRLTEISLNESTFIGRILYFVDALPQVLSHPFGLGYMGYYYIQPTFQSGVYSVAYAHNDLLQLMLDVGWIPALLFIVVVFKKVFSKSTSVSRKIIILTYFSHCCFDFDLQFIAVFFLGILLLGDDALKPYELHKKTVMCCTVSVIFAISSLYMGIALALSRCGKLEASRTLYPYYTSNNIKLMSKITDWDELRKLSDEVHGQNEELLLPLCVDARYAYSKGDFGTLISVKREIIKRAPFAYQEYEEYAFMLIKGIELYTKAGDRGSAKICASELISLRQQLRDVESKLSGMGKKIKDQPILEFPESVETYIDSLEAAK